MNTKTPRRVKKRHTVESRRRKALLKASAHTYDDLAALAGVGWRMVKFWMDDEKTSAPIAQAFETLTSVVRERAS
jgi:hypothetical protein